MITENRGIQAVELTEISVAKQILQRFFSCSVSNDPGGFRSRMDRYARHYVSEEIFGRPVLTVIQVG